LRPNHTHRCILGPFQIANQSPARRQLVAARSCCQPERIPLSCPRIFCLQAQASHELARAKAELGKLNADLNSLMLGLRDVCSSLASLAKERPEQWLLCAADLGSYAEQDEAARQLFNRCV
jgi:hypothetical protein